MNERADGQAGAPSSLRYGAHLPLSPGSFQTLLEIARLTCTAQSSGKPVGSDGSVHVAPIDAAVGPASKYPLQAALLAASITFETYPSCVPYRSSSEGRGSLFASRPAFVFAKGTIPPT